MCFCVGMVRDALSKRAVHPLASCYRKCDKEMLYTLSFSFALSRHHSAKSTHRHTSTIHTYSGTTVFRGIAVGMFVYDFLRGSQTVFSSLLVQPNTHTLWLMRTLANVAMTVLPDIEWQSCGLFRKPRRTLLSWLITNNFLQVIVASLEVEHICVIVWTTCQWGLATFKFRV